MHAGFTKYESVRKHRFNLLLITLQLLNHIHITQDVSRVGMYIYQPDGHLEESDIESTPATRKEEAQTSTSDKYLTSEILEAMITEGCHQRDKQPE